MKKLLLFAVLAISISAFAQSQRPTFIMQGPTANPTKNPQGKTAEESWKTPNSLSQPNLQKSTYHQPPLQGDVTQINDSIHQFSWDSLTNEWKLG